MATAGIIAYAFGNVAAVFATLGIWAVTFPVATAVIAVVFKRARSQ